MDANLLVVQGGGFVSKNSQQQQKKKQPKLLCFVLFNQIKIVCQQTTWQTLTGRRSLGMVGGGLKLRDDLFPSRFGPKSVHMVTFLKKSYFCQFFIFFGQTFDVFGFTSLS